MSAEWSRRTLLASLGTVPLAGCLGDTAPRERSESATDTPDESDQTQTPAPPDQVESSWPMPAGDPGRSNFAPDASGPTEEIALLWETQIDDTDLSQPVLSDGLVYVGGDSGTVRALSARTGAEQWQQSVGAATGAPWVREERLYVPTDDGIVSLQSGDGTEQWQQSVGAATGAPWVREERLYVPTDDGIVSLQSGDGTEQWRVSEPDRAGFLVAAHGVYYVRDVETPVLVARSLDGRKRWERELTDIWSPYLFASSDTVFLGTDHHWGVPWRFSPDGEVLMEERPVLGGDDLPVARCYFDEAVYSSTPIFGKVSTFDATAGMLAKQWRFVPSGSSPAGARFLAVNGETVFVYNQDRGQIVGVRGDETESQADGRGEVVVRYDGIGDVVARPVVTSDAVLVPTETRLHCLDPESAERHWQRSRDGIGTGFIVADDLIYTTVDGTIRAFRPP
jgi:outer membrane protein assembly factor BamB